MSEIQELMKVLKAQACRIWVPYFGQDNIHKNQADHSARKAIQKRFFSFIFSTAYYRFRNVDKVTFG